MSVLKTNSIQPATPGSEDYFLSKAWVNFNGTGTVAIRADGNVTSIFDAGNGLYTINFTSALPDVNYSIVGSVDNRDPNYLHSAAFGSYATTSVAIRTSQSNATLGIDYTVVSTAIFR